MPTEEEFDALQKRCDGLNAANIKNQTGWDNEIQARKDDAAEFEGRLQAALAEQAAKLAEQHAKEIADLKASVLIPALKDMQARQASDLAAKHAAELAALK